jgi:polyphosphate kinase
MNRVECGFPVYDEEAKKVVKDIIELQWNDPLKARKIDGINDTLLVQKGNAYQGIGSQQATYNYLKNLI